MDYMLQSKDKEWLNRHKIGPTYLQPMCVFTPEMSLCRQQVRGPYFVSVQPLLVFWLEHVVHSHLKLLFIVVYLLPFCSFLFFFNTFFVSFFLLFIWWLSLVLLLWVFACVYRIDFWFMSNVRFVCLYLYMYTHFYHIYIWLF